MGRTNGSGGGVVLALIGFGVLAGAAMMFVKVLVGEMTPLQAVAARTVLAAISVGAVMLVTRTGIPRSADYLRGVVVLALLDGVIPYMLIAWGQLHVTSASAGVLLSTMPLFTTLFAFVSRENQSIGASAMAGLLCGFGGVALLAGPSALEVTSSGTGGLLAVMMAAASYALAAVLMRRMMRGSVNALALTGAKLGVSAVVVVPLAAAIDGAGAYASLSEGAYASLVLLGFGSTGLGRCLYIWAIAQAGSVKASLVTYIAPVVAILLGWAVLDEPLGERTLGGAALIIFGVASVMFGTRLLTAVREVRALATTTFTAVRCRKGRCASVEVNAMP